MTLNEAIAVVEAMASDDTALRDMKAARRSEAVRMLVEAAKKRSPCAIEHVMDGQRCRLEAPTAGELALVVELHQSWRDDSAAQIVPLVRAG